MSDRDERDEQSSPQDAPVGPVPAPLSLSKEQPPPPPSGPRTPVRPVPEVIHLPAPGAPNWGLVLSGLVFMVIAAGVILNQVNGFQVQELQQVGPMLLVAVGVASALIGVVGLVARRGR